MANRVLTRSFKGIVLPGVMITPLGASWGPNQVSCRVVDEEFDPVMLYHVSEEMLRIKKPKSNDPTFYFRRATVGRAFWKPWEDERLMLEVGPSRYQYNLIHAAFEPKIREEHWACEMVLANVHEQELYQMDKLGGLLSSGVGITTVVVLADNLMVMIRRSNKVSMNAGLYHPALAEGVNPEEGLSGKIDLPSVAIRSAIEELDLPITREDLLFLGLCIDGRYWWPGIIARVKVPYTWKEVKDLSEGARDRWERDDIKFIPYTPERISDELRQAMEPEKGMTGFGAMALLQAGIVDFGWEAMERACR